MKSIAQRTTPKGTRVHVQIREGDGPHSPPVVYIDAPEQNLCCQGEPLELNPDHAHGSWKAAFVQARREGFSHMIIDHRTKVNIAITPAEHAAWQAEVEAWTAREPEVRMRRLREQRESLAISIAAIQEQEAYEKERAWEREDELRAVVDSEQYRRDIGAARLALRDFDAEHPEVLEQIRAEQEAAHQRFLNYD